MGCCAQYFTFLYSLKLCQKPTEKDRTKKVIKKTIKKLRYKNVLDLLNQSILRYVHYILAYCTLFAMRRRYKFHQNCLINTVFESVRLIRDYKNLVLKRNNSLQFNFFKAFSGRKIILFAICYKKFYKKI